MRACKMLIPTHIAAVPSHLRPLSGKDWCASVQKKFGHSPQKAYLCKMILDYPWYFLSGCLLLGAGYALALYRLGAARSPLGPRLRLLLAALRFAAVSLIAFLLLAPVVRRTVNQSEDPLILVLEDRSESVGDIELDYGLDKDYDVVEIPFGGSSTDIAAALSQAWDEYGGRNVGAIVLASDGIVNTGLDPRATAPRLSCPIYTVALGDTAQHPDAAISHVRYNKTACKGSLIPLEISVNAHHLQGLRKQLRVLCDGRAVAGQTLTYSHDRFSSTVSLSLEAPAPGLHTFRAVLEGDSSEYSQANNSSSFVIEVLEGRQKAALIGAAPHPDMAALRQALESDERYEVETFLASDLKGKISDFRSRYDLYIYHNLPLQGTDPELFYTDKPALFILGARTDLAQFDRLHTGLEIHTRLQKSHEVLPVWNDGFAAFAVEEDLRRMFDQMPPLTAPFGEYSLAASAQTLLSARIGSVTSSNPLIALCGHQGRRCVVVAGEGLWRWRLLCYQLYGSHQTFDRLVSRLALWAVSQPGRDRFRVSVQPICQSYEPVVIDAALYDENYEPSNLPEAHLSLQGRDYLFGRSGQGYRLNLGQLPPGSYSYSARTSLAGSAFECRGSFVVEERSLEQLSLVADHALLRTLSSLTGGEMLEPSQLPQFRRILAQRCDIKPVIYTHTRYTELTGVPWMLAILLLLLAAEWVLRKYNGDI